MPFYSTTSALQKIRVEYLDQVSVSLYQFSYPFDLAAKEMLIAFDAIFKHIFNALAHFRISLCAATIKAEPFEWSHAEYFFSKYKSLYC